MTAVLPAQHGLIRSGRDDIDDRARWSEACSARRFKLVVVAQEIPYPPIHGGRVDVWRRLQAFARAGIRVQLLAWAADPPDALARQALDRVCDSWQVFALKQAWPARLRTSMRVFSVPSPVATRALSRREEREVDSAVRAFSPDAIWLDQLYGAELALSLARAHGLPLLTRSHNVEHRYWRDQLKLARGIGQTMKIKARLLTLERFELSVFAASRHFYDISVDDLAYWRSRGLRNGRWLPPLAGTPALPADGVPSHDIGFIGNLFMPNNVEAVEWLVKKVLPEVREQLPGATALIAGSRPVASLRALIGADPLTELRADVSDPAAVFRAARVLVNPMLHGSGVALKSIDMLASGRDIVSTSRGVTGLPPLARACFSVADSADGFAQAIVAHLKGLRQDRTRHEEAMRLFSDDAIGVVLDDLRNLTENIPLVPGLTPPK